MFASSSPVKECGGPCRAPAGAQMLAAGTGRGGGCAPYEFHQSRHGLFVALIRSDGSFPAGTDHFTNAVPDTQSSDGSGDGRSNGSPCRYLVIGETGFLEGKVGLLNGEMSLLKGKAGLLNGEAGDLEVGHDVSFHRKRLTHRQSCTIRLGLFSFRGQGGISVELGQWCQVFCTISKPRSVAFIGAHRASRAGPCVRFGRIQRGLWRRRRGLTGRRRPASPGCGRGGTSRNICGHSPR